MIESFIIDQNYFIVFERLGSSLYDFLKCNSFRGLFFILGYPIEYV